MRTFKLGLALILAVFLPVAQALDIDAAHCRSQLLRVNVANGALTDVSGRSVVPMLREILPAIKSSLETSFTIPELDFPPNEDECKRLGANCTDRGLCKNPNTPAEIRSALCFELPCALLEGTLNAGKCNNTSYIFAASIAFPTPLVIEKIDWNVKDVSYTGSEAKICVELTELSLSMGTQISFDTHGTNLPENFVGISDIKADLDGKRDICIKARVDLASSHPLNHVRIETDNSAPFISDNMLRNAVRNVKVTGLSGYRPADLARVVPELLPVILQPIRETIESGVTAALGQIIEDQVARASANLASSQEPNFLNTQAFMSELSYVPTTLWNEVYFQECRNLVFSNRPIPVGHPCIGLEVTPSKIDFRPGIHDRPKIAQNSDAKFFSENYVMNTLDVPSFYPNVVAESFKQRLLALKEILKSTDVHPSLERERILTQRSRFISYIIDPFVRRMEQRLAQDTALRSVEIQGELVQGVRREVSIALPELCSTTTYSPHQNVSIPNCPIQVFADMNEFNRVLRSLWENGRICSSGKGVDCVLPTDSISCTLIAAPQLKFVPGTKRYATDIKLKGCRADILPFGIFGATLGGDFNVSLNFIPKACFNGDFCIDQPRISWTLARGSETGLLQDPIIRGQITSAINSGIQSAMGQAFRIPFGSATSGIFSQVPLKAEGRTKSGNGYFGVCLKEER